MSCKTNLEKQPAQQKILGKAPARLLPSYENSLIASATGTKLD